MLLSCPRCAAQMPETAAFCPGCGRPIHKPEPDSAGRTAIARENVAAALAYVTFIPAAFFLVVGPYRKNSFVRFHSVQCLLLWAAAVIVALALKLVTLAVFRLPVAGPLLVVLLFTVAVLGAFLLWLVVTVKALQGEKFKLPLLGEFAAEYSGESRP